MARNRDNDWDDRDRDDGRRPRRTGGEGGGMTAVLLIIGGVVLAVAVVCGGGIFLIYRGAQKMGQSMTRMVAEAGERTAAVNNLDQIGDALHEHEGQHGTLPPPYLKAKDSKPGLSWRVAILPHLGPAEAALYKQFKLDEPWDSPANRPLLNQMPAVFVSAPGGDPTRTHYRVFVGRGTAFDPARKKPVGLLDLVDGASLTILVAMGDQAVPWTKPEELDYDATRPLPALKQNLTGTPVLMADGDVKFLLATAPEVDVRRLITIADGQVVDMSILLN